MATIPTQSTIGASANGSNVDYGSASNAATAAANLSYAAKDTAARNSTITNQTPSPQSTASTTASAPTNQYSVVTSNPATQNYNSIQQDYNQNIKPNLQNSQASTQANSNLPVISGYNVSANPTGNAGETKATNQATGSSYYITPQNQAPTADDVKGILSGADTSPAPSNNGTDIPQTPAQQATAQTGINPSQENANYASSIQTESDSLTSAATQFQNVMNTISAGAIPLTPAQQSLVDATNSAFQAMTTNANLKAAALSSETGGVGDKTNAMGGQLVGIASDQAAAIAKLESGFQQENFTEKYQTVTAAYSALKDAETAKMDVLSKIHDTVLSTYQNALQAAQAQQNFNQSVFNTAQQLKQSSLEFRDAHDQFGNVVGTEIYDKTTGTIVGRTGGTDGNATPVPTVQINADGTPDTASQQQFLQTVPQAFQQLVKNVANYQQSTTGLTPKTKTQIESWAAQYDPTYDAKLYTTRQALQKNFASGAYSSNKNALNTAVGHLVDLTDNFSKLGNGSMTAANFVNNKAAEAVGSGAITSAKTNINAAIGELASTFKSGGATDQEIKNVGTINENSSPDQAKSFVQTAVQLLASRLNALEDTYTAGMGKPPPTSFLSQSNIQALSKLKNQGYDVPIKGIPYTDKTAWTNLGGGNQDQWHSAVQALSAAGKPLTDENILQYAQLNQ